MTIRRAVASILRSWADELDPKPTPTPPIARRYSDDVEAIRREVEAELHDAGRPSLASQKLATDIAFAQRDNVAHLTTYQRKRMLRGGE